MTIRQTLGDVIDPSAARVTVVQDADGHAVDARFDLAGLPRVDGFLAGRPLTEAISLTERLCGICPVAHHLAGVRAYEALAGRPELPPAARAIRRLLQWGSVVDMYATGLVFTARDEAMTLRRFAKAVMAAAGSPGHFPVTAVPGGVAAPVVAANLERCAALLDDARAATERLARTALDGPAHRDETNLSDAALVDAAGNIDLLGDGLRVVAPDGSVLVAAATPDQWDALVTEANPGTSAPRPYLTALGPATGRYRVGPVAQLRVGTLDTPAAHALQAEWRQGGGDAAAARAIMALHCVESVAATLAAPDTLTGPLCVPVAPRSGPGTGVGWVDGARGLLVHRYRAAADGTVASATILTPTAQNEPWLAELLRQAADRRPADPHAAMERAIRQVDPCLPCATAPPGTMGLVVETKQAKPGQQTSGGVPCV